jgi:hypothetical protein
MMSYDYEAEIALRTEIASLRELVSYWHTMHDAEFELRHKDTNCLQAALEHEQAHNKRLLAQLENWDLIAMNAENQKLRVERDFAVAAHDGQAQDKDYLAGQCAKLRAALEQLVKDVEDGEPHDVGLDMARAALANEQEGK